MQVDAAVQLPPVPLKPTCVLLFKTGPCADSWRNCRAHARDAARRWHRRGCFSHPVRADLRYQETGEWFHRDQEATDAGRIGVGRDPFVIR